MSKPLTRFFAGLIAVVALAGCGVASASPPGGGAAAISPRVTDPVVTAQALLEEFFAALVARDQVAMNRILSPAFQIERSDGSHATKAEYVANMPGVSAGPIDVIEAYYDRGALSVKYLANVTTTIDGVPFTSTQPRLAAWHFARARWQMLTLANFNRAT